MKEFVIEQRFCRLIKLKLVGLGSFEKWGPSQDTGMFPFLQVLIIRDCPRIFGLPFSNPNQDWKVDWFPKLQELEIVSCPGFLLVPRIPWTETLRHVYIIDVKLLEKFEYNSISPADLYIKGKDDLQRLDQVLAFSNLAGLEQLTLKKCPPMECKHLLMLTSLKKLVVESSDGLVGTLGGGDDVQWQHPVEHLVVDGLCGASVKKLTELLSHLPRLSELCITKCENVTQLAVGMDVQQTTSAAATEVEKEEEGLLLFPADLSGTLRVLSISECPELFPSPSCCIFPSSLLELNLKGMEGLGTLEALSNLTSLTRLALLYCGEDLRCKGLGPLLAGGGQLKELVVYGSRRFFSGRDLNLRQELLQQDEGEDHHLVSPHEACSSKLQVLRTDDTMGLLATPICSFLCSSLTELKLRWINKIEMERFSKEQEDALHLLTSSLQGCTSLPISSD